MTTREARGLAAVDTEEESVAGYLQRNPEFFERHQAVLTRLKLPHSRGGSTISLVERQIEVLREKLAGLENKLAELVKVARANDALAERCTASPADCLGRCRATRPSPASRPACARTSMPSTPLWCWWGADA